MIVVEPQKDTTGMRHIGGEVTGELEYTPPKLVVNQYRLRKKAQETAAGTRVISGKRPSRPVEKGIAGPGLLAKVIIDKYCDHIPV